MARSFLAASSQYLSTPNVEVTTAPITMCCWFKTGTSGAAQSLVGIFDTATDDEHFQLTTDGSDKVNAETRTGGITSSATSSTSHSTAGVWQHWAAVFTSAVDRKVYLNGVEEGANTTSRIPSGLDTTAIGSRKGNTIDNFADGEVAGKAIWNVALSLLELGALSQGWSPLSIRPVSLVGYLPLINDQDIDYITGLVWTATAAPTVADHDIALIRRMGQSTYSPSGSSANKPTISIPAYHHNTQLNRRGVHIK